MSTPITSHSRREKFLPPPSIKRKERDGNNFLKPLPLTTKKLAKPSPHHRHPPPLSPKPSLKSSPKPLSNNHLLAGYLANEFLSKGTLFGRPWDPARVQAVPPAGSSRFKSTQVELEPEKCLMYKEIAEIMKTDGAHIPGIVNPTQLARFLLR
ncbi:hypothetical protein LIER_08368 [Lithospermum erythrorhizon]|uniref:Uncharacterized protein n=1 Tax=Lithospermum erythrorhizon TaxID=34254 RepID=A0AAV3PFL4_LITER